MGKRKWMAPIFGGLVLLSPGIGWPAFANTVVGVAKSQDNATHWAGITQRLSESGIAYCVLDWQQVRRPEDLAGVSTIFLPNVESLTLSQAQALQGWSSRGGKLIASGPVGSLAPSEVRDILRSLLGGYWGFALTSPASLQPVENAETLSVSPTQLQGVVRGGILIPAGKNSRTAAIWRTPGQENDSPPAIVSTQRSLFFGWRWGVDAAADPKMDIAWLKTAATRYGLSRQNSTAANKETPCSRPALAQTPAPRNLAPASRPRPSLPGNPLPGNLLSNFDVEQRSAPPGLEVKPGTQSLSAGQIQAMQQELQQLIGRYESALLMANALNWQTAQDKANTRGINAVNHPPLQRAKASLQTFLELAQQGKGEAARQAWIQARRMLWDNYPTQQVRSNSEIRAVWLDRGTIIRAGSEAGLARIFDRLAASGFNTIFFETVNAGYPIYPSQVASAQNPLVKGWDPLASAVKLAHARKMELHAWVWVFAAGNQRHNTLVNQPKDYPGPIIAANPSWTGYDQRGRMFHVNSGKTFLDPVNPDARRYLQRLFAEIVQNYDVDGLQLDYIRYPFQDPSGSYSYGYGVAARQEFERRYGVDPAKLSPRDGRWRQWLEFRIQAIDSFVAETAQQLRALKPRLILSAAVFPMPNSERLLKIQQNWEVWAQRGDLDLIFPMTYAEDTNRLQSLTQPLFSCRSFVSCTGSNQPTLIIPSIRMLNLSDVVVVDQIQALRDLPSNGFSLFAAENLNPNLQSIFNRTQNQSNSPNTLPYREPFKAALERFQLLQAEWKFLNSKGQFFLKNPQQIDFERLANILEQDLQQLASNPTASQLQKTQTTLQLFQSRFPQWMNSATLQQTYHPPVWQNRLNSVQQLLAYGGKRMGRN